MRLVTALTGGAVIVLARVHLLEPRWLGGVGLVATGAQGGDLRDGGLGLFRVLGVSSGRSVAGFAGDSAMDSGVAGGEFVGMAIGANGLAGELYRVIAVEVEGGGAVVAVLAEAGRHDHGADSGEEDEAQHKDGGRPDEVGGVLPADTQDCLTFAATGTARFYGNEGTRGPSTPGCRIAFPGPPCDQRWP